MPDLAPFHAWIVFFHVLGVFLFLIAHGVSVWVVFRIRRERDPATLRTLLDLSNRSFPIMGIGLLTWFVSGIVAGFSGNYWTAGRYWIWASLAIAVAIVVLMRPLGRTYLDRVRAAVGIDEKSGSIDPTHQTDAAALEAAVVSGRPMVLAVMGVGGVALLTWLMMFKPF